MCFIIITPAISGERNFSKVFQNEIMKCKFVQFFSYINRESVRDNVKKCMSLCCGQNYLKLFSGMPVSLPEKFHISLKPPGFKSTIFIYMYIIVQTLTFKS